MLLGDARPAVDGSEYQLVVHEEVAGRIPDVDLEAENKLQSLVRAAILEGQVKSAHDVSSGGLACCLAESAIGGGKGAVIDIEADSQRPDLMLYGEAPGLIVVTVAEADLARFKEQAADFPLRAIGRVGGDSLSISVDGGAQVSLPVADFKKIWQSALEEILAH
jgi:phosphoribosylformylglycinamidine synthase